MFSSDQVLPGHELEGKIAKSGGQSSRESMLKKTSSGCQYERPRTSETKG